jgi:hypothetical protein
MANDIYIGRLNTGETIMGRVSKTGDDSITMNKPALIFTQRDPATGNQQVAIAPFAPFIQGEKIEMFLAAFQYKPALASQQLITQYIKATTNLEMPAGPGLILEA